MFQLHFSLRERQVDGKPEEDDSAQQGETDKLSGPRFCGDTTTSTSVAPAVSSCSILDFEIHLDLWSGNCAAVCAAHRRDSNEAVQREMLVWVKIGS